MHPGEGVRASGTSPCQIAYLAGCAATWECHDANPGELILLPPAPVIGDLECAWVSVPMGKASELPGLPPARSRIWQGVELTWECHGANPGAFICAVYVCQLPRVGCQACLASGPVEAGVSASYTPLCCGGGLRGWGGVWGRGNDPSHWSHRVATASSSEAWMATPASKVSP